MSYDISLINNNNKQPLLLYHPQYLRGGMVPKELSNGELVQAMNTHAELNITYNYSRYYYEASDGDERFFVTNENGEKKNGGIRGLYGKTAAESLPMLTDMIERIKRKYMDQETGAWYVTKRKKFYLYDENGNLLMKTASLATETKVHLYDENGSEYRDPINAILNDLPYRKEEKIYEVSEGDMSNYWEGTAANAIIPLMDMLHMAVEHLSDEEAVWDGD